MLINIQTFFDGFNFETVLSLISCITSVAALFFGGAAYKKCQINKNSFNDTRIINDDAQDSSQKAGRDIINYGCGVNELATLNAANFEVSLKKAYDQFEKSSNANLYQIINETRRIIEENKLDLGAYTKLDWINVYFENAKNTSDVYMQKIWAKVLAKEMSDAGSFSFRTLDILKNMSSEDFELFQELCGVQFEGRILQGNKTENIISWMNQLKLRELGVLNLDSTIRWLTVPVGGYNSIEDVSRKLIIRFTNKSEHEVRIEYTTYNLSMSGKEIMSIAEYKMVDDYFIEFAKELKKQYEEQVHVTLHNIISIDGDKNNYDYHPIDIIESVSNS